MSVFIKKNNQWQMCENMKENGSTNYYLEELGFDHNQFYSYTDYHKTYDDETRDDNIFAVCLKVMSEEIICVIANKGRTSLTDEEVRDYMQNFDFKFQYSLYTLESDLKSAITERNYTIKFVAEALGLPYTPNDKILHSEKFNYNFFFEDGILVGYETADGYNREAHEIKKDIPNYYELLESHARNYHRTNEKDIVKEINIQAKAFENLPGGVKNEYFYDFKNADNSFNVAMLLVTKYQGTEYELCLNYDECKCVCHNELSFLEDTEVGFDKLVKYRYRDYVLTFDDKGHYISCANLNKDNLISSSKEGNITKDEILRNICGVDIYNEPNESWKYEGMFDGIRNKHYIFTKDNLKDNYFRSCKVLAFDGGGSNYLWQPIPYAPAIPHQLALFIERNLKGNTNMTLSQCEEKYEMGTSSSSFDIDVDDLKFSINFGFDRKEISMTLWTNLNKDTIINKSREEHPDLIIEDPETKGDLSREEFLHNFFGVDLLNAPDRSWKYYGIRGDDNPHHILVKDDLMHRGTDPAVHFWTDSNGDSAVARQTQDHSSGLHRCGPEMIVLQTN